MATFVIDTEGAAARVVDLRDDRAVVIGRSREADIHLDDPSLSRRHCEVKKSGMQWILKDLGSFNGTYCNNLAVSEHTLTQGDQIQLGLSVLTFQLTAEEQRALSTSAAPLSGADMAEMSRRLRNFMSLLDISKAVSSVLDTNQLLELVVEKGVGLTNAERGFLILFEGQDHIFRVARTRGWAPVPNPEKVVSRSVIASVERTGDPVLTIDAQSDLKSMSQTIAALEIRSLMCAPLRAKDKVLGCIYVDSSVSEQEFSAESMNLLQAFADQAAISIENASLYDAVRQSREAEKKVRQIFQKYVPKDVVNRALQLQDGGRLSAKQTATVLFSDIRGFTSMSERMQPEEVVTFLNDYLQRMVEIVFDEGGIVDKFIGDAVMAVFGAPLPKPDDAKRAVRAAQRMIAELDRFNIDQANKGSGVHVRIGIGIHTGPLIAGNIGSDRKMEYTVIGDTVNIASRVQDLTKDFGVEIIVTQACYDATDHSATVRALPPVHVKGKELPLTVFEVPRPEVVEVPDTAESTRVASAMFAGASLDSPTLDRNQALRQAAARRSGSTPPHDAPPAGPPPRHDSLAETIKPPSAAPVIPPPPGPSIPPPPPGPSIPPPPWGRAPTPDLPVDAPGAVAPPPPPTGRAPHLLRAPTLRRPSSK